jgi:hypothetical protein
MTKAMVLDLTRFPSAYSRAVKIVQSQFNRGVLQGGREDSKSGHAFGLAGGAKLI